MDLTTLENVETIPYAGATPAGVKFSGELELDIAKVTQGFLNAVRHYQPPEDATAEEAALLTAEMTLEPIVAWDITRAGEPVPLTPANYLALPLCVAQAMAEAMGSLMDPKATKPATSAAGSRPAR